MAEKDKKFYWLKLKSEFMNGEIIDFLMSQKNGANYVVLYQMLALKTMNTQGKLCSEIGEVIIPFDPEKIQRECKWFDIDTIRVAIELYSRLGLVYKDNNDILQIANFEEMVGSETYWAKQKRLKRSESSGQSLDNVQKPLISNISNLNSNDIISSNDDITLDSDTKKKRKFVPPTLEEVEEFAKSRNSNIDPKHFYDFFTADKEKQWVDSKGQPVKNWKQKFITWENLQKKRSETKETSNSQYNEKDLSNYRR